MWAIVKFKGQEPCFFGISNAGHAHRLSTMAEVEWVAAVTVAWDGTISPTSNDKVSTSSAFKSVVIKPFQPGDPDPLEPYRQPANDAVQ